MFFLAAQPGSWESEERSCDVMPTGRVVGVLQRNWRDYVASFSEDEVKFWNTLQYCYSRGVPFSLPSKILCQHSKCGTQTVPRIWFRAPLLA